MTSPKEHQSVLDKIHTIPMVYRSAQFLRDVGAAAESPEDMLAQYIRSHPDMNEAVVGMIERGTIEPWMLKKLCVIKGFDFSSVSDKVAALLASES